MRTFSTQTPQLRGHRPRAVVLGVGDASGVDHAVEFLTTLPQLECPVVVCATPEALDAMRPRLDSTAWEFCDDGRWLSDSPVWVVPQGHLATVHQDRWELTEHDAADHDSQVGRLASSLKASYRSRVFMICTGQTLDDNVFVRLLVQRGARLVETRDRPSRAFADHATVTTIVDHLRASVGIIRKASA